MKKKKTLLLLSLGLSLTLVGCGEEAKELGQGEGVEIVSQVEAEEKDQKDNWFSAYKGTDIDGQEIDSEIFKENDLTMVNVWASWCAPCIMEIPFLGEIARELESSGKKVEIMGLPVESEGFDKLIGLSEDEEDLVRKILELSSADYRQILVSGQLLDTKFADLGSFPTTFFLDSEGRFVGKPVSGARSKEDWELIIKERLALIDND